MRPLWQELGTVAVGCGDATTTIKKWTANHRSCAEGKEGTCMTANWNGKSRNKISVNSMPETDPMFILADPERAFELSYYPNKGVGLMRMEFAISNSIKIHPLALCEPEKITDADV
jgi:pyruvate,water dikinase